MSDPLSEEYITLKNKVQNQINNLQAQLGNNIPVSTSRTNVHVCEFSSCCMKINKNSKSQNNFRENDSIKESFLIMIQNQRQLTKKLNNLTDSVYDLAQRRKKQQIYTKQLIEKNKLPQKSSQSNKLRHNHSAKSLTKKNTHLFQNYNHPVNLIHQDYYGTKQPCPIHNPLQYYASHQQKSKIKKIKNLSKPKSSSKLPTNFSHQYLKPTKKQLQKNQKIKYPNH